MKSRKQFRLFLTINLLPEKFFKYQIASGDDYLECIKALEAVKRELAQYGVKDLLI
jgi:hypothetical protein